MRRPSDVHKFTARGGIAFPFASVHRIHSHHRAVRARAAVCLSDLTCPWTMPLPASVHPVHMSIPPPRFKVYLGARSGRQRARWAGLRLVVVACRSLLPRPSSFACTYVRCPSKFHPRLPYLSTSIPSTADAFVRVRARGVLNRLERDENIVQRRSRYHLTNSTGGFSSCPLSYFFFFVSFQI